MYIATVPNRGSRPAILLREGYREGGQVKNRTLANLSAWPPAKVELLRRVLRDERLAPVDQLFDVVASPHHGHVQAVRTAMRAAAMDPEAARSCGSTSRACPSSSASKPCLAQISCSKAGSSITPNSASRRCRTGVSWAASACSSAPSSPKKRLQIFRICWKHHTFLCFLFVFLFQKAWLFLGVVHHNYEI